MSREANKSQQAGVWIGIAAVLGILLWVAYPKPGKGPPAVALAPAAPPAPAPACSVGAIQLKSTKVRFVDACTRSRCPAMKGVAVLHNGCPDAVGVQVRITGYDKAGAPMATRELWPASTRNIPPGDFTFSIDSWLDWQDGMTLVDLQVVAVERWR